MLRKFIPAFLIALLFVNSSANANVLFEGWFEVLVGSKKVGYLTERYEFTDNKFKCTSYLKTNADGNNVTESLKAFSKADLAPLSYAYTSKAGDDVKVIDATFKGDLMSLAVFDGKNKVKSSKRIKKGTFLSQFLLYLILQQKDGLSVGKNYTYSAIAEEDGGIYTGSAFIKDKEPVKGKEAYRILNEFKGDRFFIWISSHGEPLLTRAPDKNIEVRIAENQAEATKGMGVNLQDLHLLFGKVPGESGSLENKPDESTDALQTNSSPDTEPKKDSKKKKKAPVPPAGNPGNGIEIKGVPPPKTDSPTDDKPAATAPTNDSSAPATGAGNPPQSQ